jgi:hypothetical protein
VIAYCPTSAGSSLFRQVAVAGSGPARGSQGHSPAGGPLPAGRTRRSRATASVWRARDELLDGDVAVKQFHNSHPHEVVEARIAARVRHPNVVAVHDMVQHEGSCWLVMEHGGTTPATLIRGGRNCRHRSSPRWAGSCWPRCGPYTPPESCTVT